MKMRKLNEITGENAKEIRKAMKEKGNAKYYRRLEAVALRGEGRDSAEVGSITGYHPKWVSRLVSIYCTEGIAGLLKDGRKGGNNRNMSEAEAREFLSKFEEQAKSGQVITVEAIAKAYDSAVGKTHKSLSTVYYLLHKQNWRIVTPQKQHPCKASDEEIEASKKLTLSWRK